MTSFCCSRSIAVTTHSQLFKQVTCTAYSCRCAAVLLLLLPNTFCTNPDALSAAGASCNDCAAKIKSINPTSWCADLAMHLQPASNAGSRAGLAAMTAASAALQPSSAQQQQQQQQQQHRCTKSAEQRAFKLITLNAQLAADALAQQ
jgi:hypothetical protein